LRKLERERRKKATIMMEVTKIVDYKKPMT
jgi:hypothetical protein